MANSLLVHVGVPHLGDVGAHHILSLHHHALAVGHACALLSVAFLVVRVRARALRVAVHPTQRQANR